MGRADDMLTFAAEEIGKPYVYGDEGPDTFDCSGLVQFVLAKVGIKAPRTAREQQAWSQRVDDPKPGDLVFYGRPAHHVGIYIGGNRMINAPQPGARVRVDGVGTPTNYGRVPGIGGAAGAVVGGVAAAGSTVAGIVSGALGGARNIVLEGAFVALGLVLLGVGAWKAVNPPRLARAVTAPGRKLLT